MSDNADNSDQATGSVDAFPIGGGETGELIRSRDWSNTPLGPIESWPSTLRTSVQNALNTCFPMAISWGDGLYQLYNDAFATLMGDKHPDGLGRSARENWAEAWDDTGPLFERVLDKGVPIRRTDMPFVIDRHGFAEQAYFTFSYSPILEDNSDVAGIMVTVTETTEQAVSRRRVQTLNRLGLQISMASDCTELLQGAMNAMVQNHQDLPFALLYVQATEESRAELMRTIRIPRDTRWSPARVELSAGPDSEDPLAGVMLESTAQVISLEDQLGAPPGALDEEMPVTERALVAPITIGPADDRHCVGCFVFGLSPLLPFDESYHNFLMELARNTSIAYANTREHEERLDVALARAEVARQKAQTRVLKERSQLLESLERPFFGVDRDWQVIYANSPARKDPHWMTDTDAGQNLWELFPWVKGSVAELELRRAMSTGEPVEFEYSSPRTNRLYEVRAFSWEEGLSVTFLDITKRRQTARALQRSEARFRAVVEASLDVIAITDRKSRFKFVSPAAEQVLGCTSKELLGTSLFDLLPADGAYTSRGAFTRLRQQSSGPTEFRTPIQRGDDVGWLSIKARNLLDRPGVEGILLNIRDITEIHRFESELIAARERAEEMTRLKSSILTNMSHEIRTPLTSMIGMANVLAKQVPEEQRAIAKNIERGGMRLSQTLDSVLALAQIEGKAIDLRIVDVDLVREIRAAVQSLKKLATDKGLELRVVAADEPTIRVDTTFLVSILNNLIGNAIKFTEEGWVAVRISGDSSRGIFTVEDSGIGIDAEFLPYVFEEFRQESTGLARSHQGAGLGLTIARRMIEALDGTITVCSTKGVGSTFTVTFPRKPAGELPAPSPTGEMPATRHTDSELPAILVVEDDDAVRSMVTPILATDFNVTAVSDARTALVTATQREFDMVVLDIGLPDMDGVEALHRLHTIPGYAERPIVALTGYAMPGDRRRFIDEGFTDHIAKPFVPDELKTSLQQLLVS